MYVNALKERCLMPQVVMTFPNGKYKVLTMSYDDGKAADRRLVEIFNQYRIKGSFHINSGLLGKGDRIPAAEVANLYKGHEVSAHTVTHPTIARSPKEQLIEEVMKDRKALEQIVRYPVRGLSYPNGSYNNQIKEMLPYMGIEYARTVHSTGNFAIPDNFMEWQPTCHHNQNLLELAEEFIHLHKSQYLYMFYVWGHSYEFDLDQNWDKIEKFCRLTSDRDDIWYATNIQIVDYIHAFHRLQFSADSQFVYNPSAISVWLSVDGDIVEVEGGKQVDLTHIGIL